MKTYIALTIGTIFMVTLTSISARGDDAHRDRDLDRKLSRTLHEVGFTGRVEQQIELRLGRPVDIELADLGRNLFFDKIIALNGDNACAGCHAPSRGFGDTQSIAIGINNNNVVGPERRGPRNQRRSPMVLNTAFFPNLMWNSRFASLSDDPFDNSDGLLFPPPEGLELSYMPHLLAAQAFIPPTERVEMAGFDVPGGNAELRAEVVRRLNASQPYVQRFASAFASSENDAITYEMLASALAEFQFSLTFANAPIDQFARGQHTAMTTKEKKGALLFFGKANCVSCHAVSGRSNEMFSDFKTHVIGVPQISPDETNVSFDGPGKNEDFGLEQVSGDVADRYKFRTSPLRNISLQKSFFHNGAFSTLESAIKHHLDVHKSVKHYNPSRHVDPDLAGPIAPMDGVLSRLDSRLRKPLKLHDDEFSELVEFVRFGLLDERVTVLPTLIPESLPSGASPLEFRE